MDEQHMIWVNVYWCKNGLTDYSQEWKPILVEGSDSVDPESQHGMRNGTWIQNNGIEKANVIRAFYGWEIRRSSIALWFSKKITPSGGAIFP